MGKRGDKNSKEHSYKGILENEFRAEHTDTRDNHCRHASL
jgi:hypothetical protein